MNLTTRYLAGLWEGLSKIELAQEAAYLTVEISNKGQFGIKAWRPTLKLTFSNQTSATISPPQSAFLLKRQARRLQLLLSF